MFPDLGVGRALVFGTGGGNDIVSAVLIASYLQRQGVATDIAGVLNPAKLHSYGKSHERVINRIEGDIRRIIPSKEVSQASFIDAHLPAAVKHVEISSYYNLSTRFGTERLVEEVENLAKAKGYELIVGVDAGGDILARLGKDLTLISPMMDFTSLYLLGNLSLPTMLVEIAPLSDGELRPRNMDSIMEELQAAGAIISSYRLTPEDAEVKKFSRLYKEIARIRKGNTIPNMLKGIYGKRGANKAKYVVRGTIGETQFKRPFDFRIPIRYHGKSFVIDPKKLYSLRQQTAFSHSNPLEQLIKLKKSYNINTEMDLQYLWSNADWTTPLARDGKCLFVLTPSRLYPSEMRKKMVIEGYSIMKKHFCDMSLMLERDYQATKVKDPSYCSERVNKFRVTARGAMRIQLAKIAQDISDYLS